MANINFYLKGAISDKRIKALKMNPDIKKREVDESLNKPLQIYLKASTMGCRYEIYIGKKASQHQWDKEKQKYNTKTYRINCAESNRKLSDLESKVLNLIDENESNRVLTSKDEIKAIVNDWKINRVSKVSFDEAFEQFLLEHKTKRGESLKPSTIAKYNTLKKHLYGYAESKNIPLRLEIINLQMMKSFKSYLMEDKVRCDNTVVKNIKSFKPLTKFFIKKGYVTSFDLSEVVAVEREGEIYVLPIDKVLELQNTEIVYGKLARVRDIFCFGCWTGQRFADIAALNHLDIKIDNTGQKVWDFISIKTQQHIVCPITEYADEILHKYEDCDYILPPISEQKMNEYLKELGDHVGYSDITKKVKYYDGVKEEEYVPFYAVLTSHVARKSYITNSLILGVNERVVKGVSGHESDTSFKRYVKLSDDFVNEQISNSLSKDNISKRMKELGLK